MSPSKPAPRPAQRRRVPRQQRSQATVEFILLAAARVFRAEGFAATTNRIAEVAGVSIGTLYEYFPHKQALLLALAEAHVATAESALQAALSRPHQPQRREFLVGLQQAILQCHVYPSQAIELVENQAIAGELRQRAARLRGQVLARLCDCAGTAADAGLRARAAFFALAELAARALYEHSDARAQARLAELGLQMALAVLPSEPG